MELGKQFGLKGLGSVFGMDFTQGTVDCVGVCVVFFSKNKPYQNPNNPQAEVLKERMYWRVSRIRISYLRQLWYPGGIFAAVLGVRGADGIDGWQS